jgi:hypothetical protein
MKTVQMVVLQMRNLTFADIFTMKNKILIILCLASVVLTGQSVGVRAGLNYSKFRGPLEANEKYGIANGFHFGINYGYKFSDYFMVRSELQYTQTGTKQTYNGDSYYLIYTADGRTVFEKGKADLNLDVSNGYINIPITAVLQALPKIELSGGFIMNFLVNPIGRGTLRFESASRPDKIIFKQTLDYRYYQDAAQASTQFNSSRPIAILVDDVRETIPKSVGAYYQNFAKDGNRFPWYDIQATVGANYFINRGLFLGVKYNYGLLDITRNKMDRSLVSLKSDNNFILRDDFDRNTNLEVSLGFRF